MPTTRTRNVVQGQTTTTMAITKNVPCPEVSHEVQGTNNQVVRSEVNETIETKTPIENHLLAVVDVGHQVEGQVEAQVGAQVEVLLVAVVVDHRVAVRQAEAREDFQILTTTMSIRRGETADRRWTDRWVVYSANTLSEKTTGLTSVSAEGGTLSF